MKLLLTSAGLATKQISDFFISILPKKASDCSVLMIAYTQNENEQYYVDESKKELFDLGIKKVSSFNLKENEFKDQSQYDVIYVCGGNTFSILERMRSSKIDTFILDSVKNKNTIYIGVSAGSIMAGPSIEIASWGSEGDKNEVNLKDLTGFDLTNISIFPHFKPHLKQETEDFRNKVGYPVIELADNEAVFAQNLKYQLIK
ncbi:hypothetical protein EPO17_01390 [Patescibacteria group bacterium]|nr:MAG: hypothetical protein EPO17_01390 [Patescibacteria group bacterium]